MFSKALQYGRDHRSAGSWGRY